MNLGNQPVEVLIEDIYLLVVPSSESAYDEQEEEQRAQAAKQERLENAELLHVQSQPGQGDRLSAKLASGGLLWCWGAPLRSISAGGSIQQSMWLYGQDQRQ